MHAVERLDLCRKASNKLGFSIAQVLKRFERLIWKYLDAGRPEGAASLTGQGSAGLTA